MCVCVFTCLRVILSDSLSVPLCVSVSVWGPCGPSLSAPALRVRSGRGLGLQVPAACAARRGAAGGRGAAVVGRGLAALRARLRHLPRRASCRVLQVPPTSRPASPPRAPRPASRAPGLPPRAPAAGHRDARARATGRSAGAGDEREEPA